MEFDAENFIYEVQQRPSIWDNKCAEYTDKNKKNKQWEEIVDIYGGSELSLEERTKLGLTLQKKWRNIRDCFVKDFRKVGGVKKTGLLTQRKNAYTYFNKLLFLIDTLHDNTLQNKVKEREPITSRNEENSIKSRPTQRLLAKRNKTTKIEKCSEKAATVSSVNKTIEAIPSDDEDRMFFLSLVKDFKRVPEHLRLQTKAEIIQVIMNAQITSYNHTSASWTYQQNYCTNNVDSPTDNKCQLSSNTIETKVESPDSVASLSSNQDIL